MAKVSENILVEKVPRRHELYGSIETDPKYIPPAAWFLGPKAENAELFVELVQTVLKQHFSYRKDYFPTDPKYVTQVLKDTPEYKQQVEKLFTESRKIGDALKDSIPFFSMRYQGHMLWDVTIPSLVGYIAALPYNQNNTAAEASPVTTVFEKLVGDDLATLLGFNINAPLRPWGHITCDGTVANIESMWAARNLKFQAVACREALKNPALAAAETMTVPVWVAGSNEKVERTILDLDNWTLFNLDVDDILALTVRINTEFGIPTNVVQAAMAPYSVQQLGYAGVIQQFDLFERLPVVFISSTAHYSWPKASAVLGIGQRQLRLIPVDENGRMDLDILKEELHKCADRKIPVIQVVAVTGSTEESCMDPLAEILSIRETSRRRLGLNFYVHADGAWGGYFATMLRTGNNPPAPSDNAALVRLESSAYVPSLPLSPYVEQNIIAFKYADSVTIDPHKSGLIPYPAGGLVYRNGSTRYLVSFAAPIVFKGDTDPTIGIYGIEGSKPGAAATAVHLSHQVIPTNKDGYGRILGEANFSCKKLHCILQTMAADDDSFIIVPFHRLKNPEEDKEFIRTRINGVPNEVIINDPQAIDFLRNVGPDLIINAFTINFKVQDGHGHSQLNSDITKVNNLITTMFNDLNLYDTQNNSIKPLSRFGVQRKPLFFTNSTFPSNKYGKAVQEIKDRLGLSPQARQSPLNFLVNTVMDPWPTSPQFFENIVQKQLRLSILNAIGAVTDTPDIHGFLTAPQHPDSPNVTLYHKHFPMFHAVPHQYMVTVIADFVYDSDREIYFAKGREHPNELLVWANSDPLTLHEFVYGTSSDGFFCDHYIGLPPSGPPQIPFMHALMVIKDVILYEHFDTKAKYPSKLTYKLYGKNGKYHMEHYITQAPNWDNMLDVDVTDIDPELLELGVLVEFKMPEPGADLPSQSPLHNGETYSVTYTGRDAKRLKGTVKVINNFWFSNTRVNVTEHMTKQADGSLVAQQPCCFKNLRAENHRIPSNL